MEEYLTNTRSINLKKYKKHLRSLISNKNKSESIPILKKPMESNSEQFHNTDEEKAECPNGYFTSISTIDVLRMHFYQSFPIKQKVVILIFKFLLLILNINSLDVNKGVCHDQISHKLLTSTMYIISKPLCKLFNKSLEQVSFPNKWKQSVGIPLCNKGDKSSVSNYRPICLLSCICKVMERCVYKAHFLA